MIENHSKHDVIVVGAGIAGLFAAHSLSQVDLDVVVLEARDRVGGRALSVATDVGVVDLGATWFWPNEPLVQELLEEFNLTSFLQPNTGDVLYERSNGATMRIPANQLIPPSLRFTNGAQALAGALASALPEEAVRLNSPVSEIKSGRTGVAVHSLARDLEANAVVIAIPPALAINSISFTPPLPSDLQSIASQTAVWMGGMVKVMAIFERAFWKNDDLAGVAFSEIGPYRELHDHSSADQKLAAIFGFPPVSTLHDVEDAALVTRFIDQLERLFGSEAANPISVFVTNWSSEPFTSPTIPEPGHSTASFGHPIFRAGSPERIFWASTETARSFAGHVEGALRAGLDASDSVIQHRGQQ